MTGHPEWYVEHQRKIANLEFRARHNQVEAQEHELREATKHNAAIRAIELETANLKRETAATELEVQKKIREHIDRTSSIESLKLPKSLGSG